MDDSFFSRPLSPPKPPRQQQPQKAYSSLHYNSPSKENTRNGDLFNLSSADRVIKSLLDTVQTQSHQIKQLQLQQQSLAGQSLVKSSVDELSRQIAVLSEKIEVIEAEISTDPNSNPNNSNKIGLMTLANRRALASISAILSKKATTKAMEQTITTINANIIERCDSIKKFAASSREQANLSQQLISVKALINNIKQDLGEKVDRVDIEGVMSDAEYVKSHASWLYESEKKMVEMVKRVEDHKSSQTRMDDNIDSLNNHVAVLQEEMLHRVSAGDFISLKAAVSTLEKSTKTKAGQTQVDEVVKMLVAHGRQFDEVGEVFEMNAEKEAAKFRNVHKLMEEGQREVMKQVNQVRFVWVGWQAKSELQATCEFIHSLI